MPNFQINSQSVNVLMSKRVRENFFQKILHMPEKGVTEQFSEDTSAGTIRVVRQLPHGIKARKLGASVNGGNFNNGNATQPSSQEYDLPLTYVYDGNFDIPEVAQDMVDIRIAEAETDNIAGEFATAINGSTIATQLAAALNATCKDSNKNIIKVQDGTGNATVPCYKDGIINAMSLLDDGDTAHGVQSFPSESREIIGRPSLVNGLLKSGQIIVGGSNYAQEMLARGMISPDTYRDNGTSYRGEFLSTPIYFAASALWSEAEDWIDVANTTSGNTSTAAMADGGLTNCLGVVVSAIGTARGIAMSNTIKQIDCPRGAGVTLQPLYRWGVECWYPKSVVVLGDASFSNPASWTNATTNVQFAIHAPGSRS